MASLLPTITSRRATSLVKASAREILDSLKTFAADGGARPNPGGTPFRQPCPAYPSTKGRKAPQERFSEEKFPNSLLRKRISQTLLQARRPHGSKTHSTQQAWMYSRNQTTIASARKHRQLVFLHPTLRTIENPADTCRNRAVLADSASSLYTTGFPFNRQRVRINFRAQLEQRLKNNV